jgi:hypothetical protein
MQMGPGYQHQKLIDTEHKERPRKDHDFYSGADLLGFEVKILSFAHFFENWRGFETA